MCRDFVCQWLRSPQLGHEWFPAECGMLIYFEPPDRAPLKLRILVDPLVPGRWREARYRHTVGEIALSGLLGTKRLKYHTIATCGGRDWLILPDSDVEITGKTYVVTGDDGFGWNVSTFDTQDQARKFADALAA